MNEIFFVRDAQRNRSVGYLLCQFKILWCAPVYEQSADSEWQTEHRRLAFQHKYSMVLELRGGVDCGNDPFLLTSWGSHRNNARNREFDSIIERFRRCWTGNIPIIIKQFVIWVKNNILHWRTDSATEAFGIFIFPFISKWCDAFSYSVKHRKIVLPRNKYFGGVWL